MRNNAEMRNQSRNDSTSECTDGRRLIALCATLACFAVVAGDTRAGDWPQILGPNRNGVAEGESIVDRFPAGGPQTVWQRSVGSGYAGIAVADGIAVLFHRLRDKEIVEAMDAATGDVKWTAEFDAKYRPSFIDDSGPRAVPVIHNSRVYVYGAQGGLHCLELQSGKTVWSRKAFDELGPKRPFRGEPPEGYFGIGSCPLVEGNLLLVNVGGDSKQAGIVAFALADGKTVWTATDERASYSSPVAATIDGVRHVFFATRLNALSIDPKTGDTRFSLPFGEPGPKVTGANPLVIDGHLLLTASYGVGAVYAKIESNRADIQWTSDNTLSSQYTTSIVENGAVYGVHGRQDMGRAALRCIDPVTQKVLWSEDGFGYATLIKADGKLLVMKTDGELVLVQLSPQSYRELDRAQLLNGTARALPALSNGSLFVRDERTLRCVQLGRP